MTDRTLNWSILGGGVALYLALALGILKEPGVTSFGDLAYNYYFLSLLEGRFDVPVRIITIEGHYDAAGQAYVYHGMAPLLVRALLFPFVDLRTASLAPISVWLFAAGGTAAYHLTFVKIVERYSTPWERRKSLVLIGLMTWLASPGVLLAANTKRVGSETR